MKTSKKQGKEVEKVAREAQGHGNPMGPSGSGPKGKFQVIMGDSTQDVIARMVMVMAGGFRTNWAKK